MSPLTPFRRGCKPCVYQGFDTLAPLNGKISIGATVDYGRITFLPFETEMPLKP